jgi:DNA-binding FrmR family transcriptional regulator
MEAKTVPGYVASKDDLLNRLRRIGGQLGGIERMIDEERYCIDVLTQIGAAQAALDKVALGLLDDHVNSCVVDAKGSDRRSKAKELTPAITRLLRRG